MKMREDCRPPVVNKQGAIHRFRINGSFKPKGPRLPKPRPKPKTRPKPTSTENDKPQHKETTE